MSFKTIKIQQINYKVKLKLHLMINQAFKAIKIQQINYKIMNKFQKSKVKILNFNNNNNNKILNKIKITFNMMIAK